MSIQSNTFCWHGISTELESGKAFYTQVLGWHVSPDSDGAPMFIAPGGAVAHIQAPENGPPSWCSFLAVDDLDGSTTQAIQHGSTVLVPPTDLPAGRFSVVTTPSGAAVGLYQGTEEDTQATPGPGSILWVELQSSAPDKDIDWLTSVFGFSCQAEQMPDGPYHLLTAGGAAQGGVKPAAAGPSVFIAWVQVRDLDATLAKVGGHGGKIMVQATETSERRSAVVCDPSGATFGLVQPI